MKALESTFRNMPDEREQDGRTALGGSAVKDLQRGLQVACAGASAGNRLGLIPRVLAAHGETITDSSLPEDVLGGASPPAGTLSIIADTAPKVRQDQLVPTQRASRKLKLGP